MPHHEQPLSMTKSASSTSEISQLSEAVAETVLSFSRSSTASSDDTSSSSTPAFSTASPLISGTSIPSSTREGKWDKKQKKTDKKSKTSRSRGPQADCAEEINENKTPSAPPVAKAVTDPDPFEEYFVQQARLFRHLEKRYVKFQNRSREEQARIKKNRAKYKNNRLNLPVLKSTPSPTLVINQRSDSGDSDTPSSTSRISGEDDMIGSSVAARGVKAIVHPAISVTRASSPVPSASFSSSSVTSARVQALKKKKKRVVNPDAMSAAEAATVLRALEIANPTSSYSLTLSTKSAKSALPIRGHFQLPADPRRSSEIILVFAEPNSPSSALAKQAGAAHVGGDELFEAVLSGKVSPTRCLATPGMMPSVTRALARYLGPKGLMPVAKRGLVGEGEELAQKIREAAGRMEYRADKQGLVRIRE
ncbi:50S small subunit ribosomal protein L1 [Kwoniella heveanensis BCC8398]|uniref:50S small subunit ribosomal protein L1 n=1 Tax=Kwoniella heveanensis BCC8398 TaxID=1296120 RepID=A0A1B9GXX9_9TREE|nr:50S small subunit ribosomal protein L1 [Kwoniella heveanensis BCC8398]